MHIKTRGIVLRETKYKEADKILTVLTEEGKCTVKAPGCRRKNSALAAPSQLLAYSELTLLDYQDHLRMTAGETIEEFRPIRGDLELLALGSYFAEVTEAAADEGSPDEGLLPLLLNSLYALGTLKKPPALVKPAFELRLLCLIGYAPMLEACAVCGCGEPREARLQLREGTMRCSSCPPAEDSGIALPLSPDALRCMRYVAGAPARRIFSFRADEGTLAQMASVCEAYLMTQLERGFRTLDFYKSLSAPLL